MSKCLHLVSAMLAVASILAPALARAQETSDHAAAFVRWDTDGDGRVDANEARRGVVRRGARHDRDGDGRLDDRELAQLLHETWDRDRDGRLDYREWTEANEAFLRREDRVPFGDVDRDGSISLDVGEVRRGLLRMRLREVWDADGDRRLTARELGRGLVASQDRDASGDVDRREWFAG